MTVALRSHDLQKDFGRKRGVFGVNITVRAGEIVGFVGPNGAGKSTTIGMLCGNLYPDNGSLELLGQTVTPTTIQRLMPRLGVLLAEPNLEPAISARQACQEAARLLGKTADWQTLSRHLQLDVDTPIGKLSLGNKKKVGIILTLMHRPELVIMDEPTSGIDPLILTLFTQLLRDSAKQGGAVLLSSHDLGEIQSVCDRIIMIKAGRIIIDQPVAAILQGAPRIFTVHQPSARLRNLLQQTYTSSRIAADGSVHIQTDDFERLLHSLINHRHYDFLIEKPTLEELFTEQYE